MPVSPQFKWIHFVKEKQRIVSNFSLAPKSWIKFSILNETLSGNRETMDWLICGVISDSGGRDGADDGIAKGADKFSVCLASCDDASAVKVGGGAKEGGAKEGIAANDGLT